LREEELAIFGAHFFAMHRILLLLLSLAVLEPASAQWRQVAKGLLGKTSAATFNQHGSICFQQGKLWAGRTTLWSSEDSGVTWRRVTGFPGLYEISHIRFFDRLHGLVATTSTAYATQDGGVTWQILQFTGPIMSVAYGSTFQNQIIVGNRSLSRTSNNGRTWTRYTPGGDLLYAASSRGLMYVQSDTKNNLASLLISTDDGASWGRSAGEYGNDSYSFAVDSSGTIFVANEEFYITNNRINEIYRSKDTGATWSVVFQDQSDPYLTGAIELASCVIVAQTWHDGNIFSVDGGETWNPAGGPPAHFDTRHLAIIDNSTWIAIDSLGGIWRNDIDIAGTEIKLQTATRYSTDTIGGTIAIPLTVTNPPLSGEISFRVRYDSSNFRLLGYSTGGEIVTASQSGRIHIPSDKAGSGSIVFESFPVKDSCSSMTLDEIDVIVGGKHMTCFSYSTSTATSSATMCAAVSCGDPMISNFLRRGKIPSLYIVPNPAREVLVISFDQLIGSAQYEIVNLVGAVVSRGTLGPASPGSISVGDIPRGYYFFRIKKDNASENRPILLE
jgi:photosystem II stability/assembly factor-like uncharacterized protein